MHSNAEIAEFVEKVAQAMGVDPKITHCGSLLRRLSEPGAKKPQPIRRSA